MLGAGDTAPDFHLEDVNGREKSLRNFISTKPALLALFKVNCPVCQWTFPFLERLSKSDKIEVVAISQDGLEATEEFRNEFGITFTTLLDEPAKGYPASNAFGIVSVPSLFLVEPGGEISLSGAGFSKRELEAVGHLAGVQPFRPGENIPEFKAG
jgi:peroxiredoxin